ncbi:putative late blight resistance protein homolog R1B-16 [Helianthus annuus]|nr:putative late blight resistance protein homolog R1B-16 [Helianthus annuus]XP_021977442.1 putative late blight resistance protein homolog R1B-16 [Helianthus annuus]
MADANANALILKRLISSMQIQDHKKIPYDKRKYYKDLIDHLRSMMLGYENEEVKIILHDMELEFADSVVPAFSRYQIDMVLENCEKLLEIRYGSDVELEETVEGFDDEVQTLLDQLTTTCTMKLQVLTIAGMAGLGKTTLARKLYKDPLIEYTFHYRAWNCVSQTYLKRDLLLGVLSHLTNDLTDETNKMSDEQLGETLYRLLKGHRYLVVFDDIWDCTFWNDIRIYFPDDKVGSRVLFTTRDIELSLHVKAAKPTHVLRLRTENESWKIFSKKVFRTGVCPYRLKGHARAITRKCKGLPLAIVITAGILKNNWAENSWLQISESLHSFMVRDPGQYMDSLALSYNQLPLHLRQCFVFVGVFPEDYDIPVTKLIWLWIAQGFIHETESGTLEDVAEDFLMDLIKRSLLIPGKRRVNGQIKTCRIHDLLRDLCRKKADEENFSQEVRKHDHATASLDETTESIMLLLPLEPPELSLLSDFCYPSEFGKFLRNGQSFDIERYESLRTLDVESISVSMFPAEVTQLLNLRYLAIQARDGSPSASISSLVNLQMLIIASRKNIVVPKTIWSMVNLRHLCIKTGENHIEDPCFVHETKNDRLQTLSQVSPQSCHNIFSRTPNLRKLGICGPLVSSQGELEFPNIRALQHLQKLKLLNTIPYGKPTRLLNTMMFPETLKNLTLSNTCMDWEDMWALSLLLNLEVLKLKFHACIGETWETDDVEFKQLKILKLHNLNLSQWVCWRENFPGLKRLVVRQCLCLESIPSELGKINTLEAIEVQWCRYSTQVSALKIQKEQESEGNFFLKVHATNNR